MRIFVERASVQERHRREELQKKSAAKGSYYAIAMDGHRSDSAIDKLVMQSFARALMHDSKLPDYVRAIQGMSGQIYRSFINNLMGDCAAARYLEIGSWAGSTAAAALYGNKAKCLCIDNWSEFGGPRDAFFSNIARVRSSDIDFEFIEKDFRAVDYSAVGSFNVYMFDGPHAPADHYDGIKLVQPALDASYVLIVDDWNWAAVREPTLQALIDTNSRIESCIEVRTTFREQPASADLEHSD
jgi:hypothetical protein